MINDRTNDTGTVSMYTVNNPYGYRLNLNHPQIRELAKRYCAWKKIRGRPMTDEERFEFEDLVLKKR